MEVSGAKFVEEENFISQKIKFPCTYFSLTPKEQKLYDSFRNKHKELARTIDTLPNKDLSGDTKEIRLKGERAISSMFLNLVNPYFSRQDLKPVYSFIYYGKNRETLLNMPTYILSDEKGPSQKELDLDFWFLTQDETLSCRSHFSYSAKNSHEGIYEQSVFYDILKRAIEKKTQDGINFPFISFRGCFIDFASTDLTLPFMIWVKKIFDNVGPERINELKILYKSFVEEARHESGGFSDAKIKKDVFEKAYASTLEITLLEAGPF